MLNRVSTVSYGDRYNSGLKKNIMAFYPNGYWGTEDYFINNQDSIILQKILKCINDSSNVNITKKDVIYTTKSSEIPRFKLKEFIKETGVKKTSRSAYANIFIINKGVFRDLLLKLKYGKHLFINSDIINDKNIKLWFNGYALDTITSIINANEDKNNIIYVNTDNQKYLDNIFKKDTFSKTYFENNTHVTEGIIFSTYREAKLIELLNLFISNSSKIIKGDIKFVWDEDLFIDLNKEGIELDDDYLQTLRDMLFSKDESNVKLGFEMMSNLVIDQPTLLTISFLLNEMFHTTRFRPSYYTNTNTNLKALLKMLKTKGIAWDRDWKTFGTGLRGNFKVGKEGEIVKKFLLDNINREFKISNSAAESLVDIVFTTEAK